MKIAVFAGSFDPITKGHLDIVQRALPLFDKIIVAMGINSAKKYYFETTQRIAFLEAAFASYDKVEVDTYQQLTAFYCKERGVNFLIRGLRNGTDFDYEKTIAYLNSSVGDDLETIFLTANPEYSCFSSTLVREILKNGGDASLFLPATVLPLLPE